MKSKWFRTMRAIPENLKEGTAVLTELTPEQLDVLFGWFRQGIPWSDNYRAREARQALCDQTSLTGPQVAQSTDAILTIVWQSVVKEDDVTDILDDLLEGQLIDASTHDRLLERFEAMEEKLQELVTMERAKHRRTGVAFSYRAGGYVTNLRAVIRDRFDFTEQKIEDFEPELYDLVPTAEIGIVVQSQGTLEEEAIGFSVDFADLESLVTMLLACQKEMRLLQDIQSKIVMREAQ
jgi:hypothetical protein